MKRKASYKLRVTRRECLYVHDEPDHSLMVLELEGEPIEYEVGVAGEFVSRRSVNFHDRIKGSGPMQGYTITNFQYGSVYSRFEGYVQGHHRGKHKRVHSGHGRAVRTVVQLAAGSRQQAESIKYSERIQ